MSKLVILQTVVPDYRKKLFIHLKKELGGNFEVFGGKYYFEKTVKTDESFSLLQTVVNKYFFKRKFLFQFGMWSRVFQKNTLIIELNPRIISNWLILIIRKVLCKQTVLWGHAWPRKGEHSTTDSIRGVMRNLSSSILVYTKTQKKELQKKMPNKKINCAPNSLLFKDEMETHDDTKQINNIIYVGRLTKEKKPMLLLKSFAKVLNKLPDNAKLILVGDGDEKSNIEQYVNKKKLNNRVEVLGHIGDYNKLKSLYKTSLLSVSPGYIGLSVTQSFSFGVPMIVSLNENHSPEIESVKSGFNAEFFETDKVESLGDKILLFYQNKASWVIKRKSVLDYCKNEYSIEAMSQGFLDLIEC
ncbi:glycosyltransferase [Corallibacter sp.]|uniref:glycosyltransferase n=1 Tax=Corallibacter sp. TaxID=2038084 RepID=UPI003A941050